MTKTTLPQQNQKAINELEKSLAILGLKVDNLLKETNEIKSNHMVHFNDQLTALTQIVNLNNTNLTALINTKIGEIYSKLTELKIADAKQEPANKLLNKVIEYVIIAVIAIALSLVFTQQK